MAPTITIMIVTIDRIHDLEFLSIKSFDILDLNLRDLDLNLRGFVLNLRCGCFHRFFCGFRLLGCSSFSLGFDLYLGSLLFFTLTLIRVGRSLCFLRCLLRANGLRALIRILESRV
jgi:hypothetical protein